MRLGFAVSGLGHAAVVAVGLVALANPRMLDATPEPVTVEIVAENEIPPPEKEAQPQIRIELPTPGPTETRERRAAQTQPETSPKPEPQKSAGLSGSPPPAAASPPPPPPASPQPPAPSAPTAAAAAQQTAAAPSAPTPAAPAASSTDAFSAAPLFLPSVVPSFGAFEFDTEAERGAKLPPDAMMALQAHLQKCWNPPASLASASKLRMTLRIALAPNGTLARDPLLIRASASAQGPRLVETATRALQECQPLGLPPDRYDEWKVLDLSFSPKGLM